MASTKTISKPAPSPSATLKNPGGLNVSWIAALAVAIVTTAVYFGVTHQDFVHWDDGGHVFNNPYLHRLDRENLLHFWKQPYEHLYIPLSYMAFALLCAIARLPHRDPSVTVIETLLNPHVFHTANLFLHVGNSLLVFAILCRLTRTLTGGKSAPVPAAFGALIFAVHPLQVESVAWISELRGQLSSIFCLGTILAYLSAVERSSESPWRSGRYWLAFALTIIGLLCKPSIITVGLLLIVVDRWMLRRSWRACLLGASPWLILAVPFTLLTQHAQPVDSSQFGAVWQRPFVAGDALTFYLAKFFAPVNLAIEYGRRPEVVLQSRWAYLTWLVPAAVAAVVFACRRRFPWLVAGWLISLAVLLPVLGLTPFAFQNYSTVADRYVYLAMIGPALIVACALTKAVDRGIGRPAFGAAAVVVAVLCVLTVKQVQYWNNSVTLYTHAIAVNPDSYGLRTNYGLALEDFGRWNEAIDEYKKAIALLPNVSDAYQNTGFCLARQGKLPEALSYFRQSAELDPENPASHGAIGKTLLSMGNPTEALPELEKASELAPNDAQDRAQYADGLLAVGRVDDARAQYNSALSIDPSNITALMGLAGLNRDNGSLTQAEEVSRRAVDLDPGIAITHATLADILLKEDRAADAVSEFRQATTLSPGSADFHFGLGQALARSGDRPGALQELQQAADLAPTPQHDDQLGVAYATLGNLASAGTEFQAAVALDPHYAPALKHIGMLKQSLHR